MGTFQWTFKKMKVKQNAQTCAGRGLETSCHVRFLDPRDRVWMQRAVGCSPAQCCLTGGRALSLLRRSPSATSIVLIAIGGQAVRGPLAPVTSAWTFLVPERASQAQVCECGEVLSPLLRGARVCKFSPRTPGCPSRSKRLSSQSSEAP